MRHYLMYRECKISEITKSSEKLRGFFMHKSQTFLSLGFVIFVPVLIFCPDYLRYVYLKQNRRFDIFLLFLFLNRSASLQQSDPQQYFGGRPVAAARKCPKTKCFRSPTLSVKRKSFWFNLIEKNDFL